ncbi:DNA repair protein [Pedobacter sp. Leaf41]|nr:DNA repair protein [Pedobacter sp. Leaf41]
MASVHYNSEDEVFFGKVIGINDLITFEGSSVSELKNGFFEAVDDYLETCKELGKSPDKTYKGVFNLRISSSLHKQVALSASQYKMTLNDFVKTALS